MDGTNEYGVDITQAYDRSKEMQYMTQLVLVDNRKN